MEVYRLYFMNLRYGHIERYCDFEAPDDVAAVAIAVRNAVAQPMELWAEHRKIQRFEPDAHASQNLAPPLPALA